MTTKIDEWGDSLAVRIPKKVIKDAALRKGAEVEITAVDDGILISRRAAPRARRRRPGYRLSELVAGCKGPNPYKFISGELKPLEMVDPTPE